MGNSASSSGRGPHDDTVDFGFLTPQGVYTGQRDWNESIVGQLICERKLAPFYRPLEDYDPSWDDERILAARKEPPNLNGDATESIRSEASSTSKHGHHKRPSNVKDVTRSPEAAIYRGAVECPICFLYYPSNINKSRCCDQAICTECFVQIKRSEPTVTHLQSDPACCPYCVQEYFGVVYTPPRWRAGIGSEGWNAPSWPEQGSNEQPPIGMQKRRKSFGADSSEVVTTDQIRPDWESKLAAVKAAAARRANRRIIMRQVGDRLIPVGVTSGRVHALPAEGGEPATGDGSGSRRSRRRQQNELNHLLGSMGLGGQDLEELMVMEAMRLSLLEHEEQQRREAQQRTQNGGEGSSAAQSPSEEPAQPASEEPSAAAHSSSISISFNAAGDRVPASSHSASPSPISTTRPGASANPTPPNGSTPPSPATPQPIPGTITPVIVPSPEPAEEAAVSDVSVGHENAHDEPGEPVDLRGAPHPPATPTPSSSASANPSLTVPVELGSRQMSIGSSIVSEPSVSSPIDEQDGGSGKGKGKEKEGAGYSMLASSEESLVARAPLLRSETMNTTFTQATHGDGEEADGSL